MLYEIGAEDEVSIYFVFENVLEGGRRSHIFCVRPTEQAIVESLMR
jgi:hypothetical protein